MKAIFSRSEYFDAVISGVAALQAGDRVTLATMSFAPEDASVGLIVDELEAAARRGVAVKLIVDAYPFLLHNGTWPGPLFFKSRLPERLPKAFQIKYDVLKALRASGGHYAIINRPSRAYRLPVAGRSHLKFAIINDQVFIGGCNLDRSDTADIMAGWDDPDAADWLQKLADAMMRSGSAMSAMGGEDLSYELDEASTLLVDAGVPGRSLIFEKALELIDSARERVVIACQFFPNDVTARHLLAAYERGVKVEILYNHPSQHVFPYNALHHYATLAERLQLPKSFFVNALRRDQPFLHAKLIVTEQGAILGSHNFVTAGIKLGTAEIALVSYAPEFAGRAAGSIARQITR